MRTFVCTGLFAISIVVGPYAASGATASVERPQWEPGVRAIAKKVERLRGLRFLHPVPVTYLSPKAFNRKLAPRPMPLTLKQRKLIVRLVGRLRAFGFLTGHVDPSTFIATSTAPALAFYSPTKKRIYARGDFIGVVRSVILAHELTHALQDQHFHLLKLQRAVVDADAAEALQGLVEGDAKYTEDLYLGDLSKTDQRRFATSYAALQRATPDAVAGLRGLPDLRSAFVHAPYTLGEQMVALVDEQHGRIAVNRLFRHPPERTSAFLTPLTLLSNGPAFSIRAPHLHAGEVADVPTTVLDPLTLYLMLAGRIDSAAPTA